jgi:hypothetical protein
MNFIRAENEEFYIPSSSCILLVNNEHVKFQLSTGSLITSLCSNTIKSLNVHENDHVCIKINNQSYSFNAICNQLEGNILGLDILSQMNVTFKKGQIYFNNLY